MRGAATDRGRGRVDCGKSFELKWIRQRQRRHSTNRYGKVLEEKIKRRTQSGIGTNRRAATSRTGWGGYPEVGRPARGVPERAGDRGYL